VRIFWRVHRCVSWKASAASRSFSKIVRLSSSDSAFLTNCSAIVEAPCRSLPATSASTARRMPLRSTPGSCQKRLSSTATIAFSIVLPISAEVSITTLLGGAKMPIGRP